MTRSTVRDAMLEVASHMIDEVGESGVRLERILELTDASPSSLYHHFGNLRGLIEEAQIHRFTKIIDLNVATFIEMMQTVTTREEFCEVIDSLLARFAARERRPMRYTRVNAVGSAYLRPEFRDHLGTLQRESLRSGAEALESLRHKNLYRPDFDPVGFLAWFDGLFFGRVLTEITRDDDALARWDAATRESIYVALFGADGFALIHR